MDKLSRLIQRDLAEARAARALTAAAAKPVAPEPGYGVGRVPADVDPTLEALAEAEAQEILRQHLVPTAAPTYRPRRCSYRGCQRAGTMNASLGPACPDHYDALSG